jgi:hypothetical protein
MAKVPFAKDHHVVNAVPATEPMSLAAYPFCQGERAEFGPMAPTRRMNSAP